MQPHGVTFRYFHDQSDAAAPDSLSAAELRALIGRLGPERILPADEWMRRAERGELDLDELCLTFDGNLRCQYEIARPVLREMGLTAFWFVGTATMLGQPARDEVYRRFRVECFDSAEAFYLRFRLAVNLSAYATTVRRALERFDTEGTVAARGAETSVDAALRYIRDNVLGPRRYAHVMDRMIADAGLSAGVLARGLWMDAACIRHLHEDGHVIGLYSHTCPPRIASLHPEAQFREYRENLCELKQVLGEAPRVVAHPGNSYNEATLTILRRLGVTVGFRADMLLENISELEYARRDQSDLAASCQQDSPHRRAMSPSTTL